MPRTIISLLVVIVLMLASCCEKAEPILRIAISKEKSEKSTSKYADWLLRHENKLDYFNMYELGIDSALALMETCDGLLVTGGEDVFPGNYGKIDDTARCGSFDLYRDSLEFALIKLAKEKKIPIFGVCRGEQILNISQGGTLYIDIPTDFDSTVAHRQPNWARGYHPVWLVENTLLENISGTINNRDVVSSHHQGIEILGDNLIITAYAADSMPEAIEWQSTSNHPFLMAVQWHPEAMDTLHPLSAPFAKKFLLEASNYMNAN